MRKSIKTGEIRNLENSDKEIILNQNSNMADRALRVLAISYLDVEKIPSQLETENVEKNLIFVRINSE